ncbi:4a-hydroxytetrahydrobiopterin dehydratase [Nocardia bhagyanarayanae]|uniref:Putative pterin-4-alpha-carbinolamine dehydratase n=1 Tax=Nocardia bhagyanarayanae TaxID=1215925 RepID=A0A543FA73_9NOCA|nr:4a-hydroxytetrahydrobiopterin dehydratase [Nocardia bhagyanarayanae]TQM30727.1 4a-hydroxytetrahydrobiopterin dehydratase [Nocardia bhagyanarayanae]
MSTPLLSEAEIADALAGLPNWSRSGDNITRTIKASSFPAGIDLVRRVADAAEAANHHPDIDIRWRNVTFTLSTHSAGGLTALDLGMAREIDLLASQSE